MNPSALPCPTSLEAITPAWVSEALRASGVLGGGEVKGFTAQKIGIGQMADSVRLTLDLAGAAPGCPKTVVAKLPSSDEQARATSAALDLYSKEVRFYQEIAPIVPVRAPLCHAAWCSDDGREFVLLMEDLAPARAGDQLTGCSLDDARHAIVQAAKLHGATWNRDAVVKAGWTRRSDAATQQVIDHFAHAQGLFAERYADLASSEALAVCARMSELARAYMLRETADSCLVHGDFRLDNMMFDVRGGQSPIAVFDYQSLFISHGLVDIAYFLGAGTGSALRRSHEEELLALYVAEMARQGVVLAAEDVMREFRIGAAYGLMVGVFSAAFAERTPRGDQSYLSMVTGAADLLLDHDGLEELARETHCA